VTTDPNFDAYSSDSWYPRPHRRATTRGMEVLVKALADQTPDLRLQHDATAINLDDRIIVATHRGEMVQLRFEQACCSTLPLPATISLCRQAPEELRSACAGLPRNRVLSIALSMRGPRPEGRGHWRYYADETLVFSRLVYLHEFDPNCAPLEGWCLLVEITEPAETPAPDLSSLLRRVRIDLDTVARFGALGPEPSRGLPTVAQLVGKRERNLARPAGLEPPSNDTNDHYIVASHSPTGKLRMPGRRSSRRRPRFHASGCATCVGTPGACARALPRAPALRERRLPRG
jgi:hypothetical protein